jgi:hypothetical protein
MSGFKAVMNKELFSVLMFPANFPRSELVYFPHKEWFGVAQNYVKQFRVEDLFMLYFIFSLQIRGHQKIGQPRVQ